MKGMEKFVLLKTWELQMICRVLHVKEEDISEVKVLKKGMTNRSYFFRIGGLGYIFRVPGEGTEKLISREQEAAVYHILKNSGICEDVVYIDPQSGNKITRYYENARVCDPLNEKDVERCMGFLRCFHDGCFQVSHEFDLFRQINLYERLWQENASRYRDYRAVKEGVFELGKYIKGHSKKKVLTHIDAVSDNLLFIPNKKGGEDIKLIDWEYAGMQDPHVDIAMFCIYALYDRAHIDTAIDVYFPEGCRREDRIKIYCYIAVCGLLWSNWCEYKEMLGIKFGEYGHRQYDYAKEYYGVVKDMLKL